MGLPDELTFATKGELAVQILTEACADGMVTDFVVSNSLRLRTFRPHHATAPDPRRP